MFDVRLVLELSVERKHAVLHGNGIARNADEAFDELEIGLVWWVENQDVPTADRGVPGDTDLCPGNAHTNGGTIRDQEVANQKCVFHGP